MIKFFLQQGGHYPFGGSQATGKHKLQKSSCEKTLILRRY